MGSASMNLSASQYDWLQADLLGVTRLDFISSASGEWWLMDDFTYEPVPEPTTMLLLGTGLVGVAGAARRKKKNQA